MDTFTASVPVDRAVKATLTLFRLRCRPCLLQVALVVLARRRRRTDAAAATVAGHALWLKEFMGCKLKGIGGR